jgi:2-C-methyl-D-erythritol 4-phosphate cytidylyltransferase
MASLPCPYNEQIFVKDDEISTVKYIPRETLRRVQTPQAYKFGKLDWAYHKAFAEGIGIKGLLIHEHHDGGAGGAAVLCGRL